AHLGIHALGAAIDLLLEIGADAIEARLLELTGRLAEELQALGATILSPMGPAERSSILTFALGDAPRLQRALTDAAIIVRQRLGGIRLAPHFYNDADDIGRVVEAVKSFGRG